MTIRHKPRPRPCEVEFSIAGSQRLVSFFEQPSPWASKQSRRAAKQRERGGSRSDAKQRVYVPTLPVLIAALKSAFAGDPLERLYGPRVAPSIVNDEYIVDCNRWREGHADWMRAVREGTTLHKPPNHDNE